MVVLWTLHYHWIITHVMPKVMDLLNMKKVGMQVSDEDAFFSNGRRTYI